MDESDELRIFIAHMTSVTLCARVGNEATLATLSFLMNLETKKCHKVEFSEFLHIPISHRK